jgi:hypothetical protein
MRGKNCKTAVTPPIIVQTANRIATSLLKRAFDVEGRNLPLIGFRLGGFRFGISKITAWVERRQL